MGTVTTACYESLDARVGEHGWHRGFS